MSSFITFPENSNIVISNNSFLTSAGTQLTLQSDRSTSVDGKGVSPRLYFKFVKSKLEKLEKENLKKKLIKLQNIVNDAKDLKQQALYEKLMETIAVTVREMEVAAIGCDRWISQEVINKFNKVYRPQGNKIVHFDQWEKFPRTPPKETQEKIKRIMDLKLFDEYFVLYLDYAKQDLKTNKEKIREKDPILFGKFSYAPDKYYFIVDWIDDYCDLTFDKFVDTIRSENPVEQKLPELTPEYFKQVKKEVMERHERLKNSNNSNFRANMAEEDRLSKEKTKKQWWKFWRKG